VRWITAGSVDDEIWTHQHGAYRVFIHEPSVFTVAVRKTVRAVAHVHAVYGQGLYQRMRGATRKRVGVARDQGKTTTDYVVKAPMLTAITDVTVRGQATGQG